MNMLSLVPLAEMLNPVSRPERVDPEKTYRILGAHWYAGGLYVKDTLLGAQIRADKVFRVEKGDFVYNRLFAWKGSFAVATEANAGCYVSNEFPCFVINQDRADDTFLWRYFSRVSAWDEALGLSTGGTPTSRNRLKEEKFLAIKIPLPPLPAQRRIVARIEGLAAKIKEARGLRQQQQLQMQQLLLSTFWRISRAAPRMPMGDVAPLVRRPVDVGLEDSYPELGIRSFGNGTFHKPPLSGADVGSKRIFKIETGDLLFSNVFAWEGAIAVARPADDGRFGSHRFITCVPRSERAMSSFLCFYFLTDEGLELIRAASPGGAGRNRTLGLETLASISVPVPTLEHQRWFGILQTQVDTLRGFQGQTATELDALLPSILDKAFKGEL